MAFFLPPVPRTATVTPHTANEFEMHLFSALVWSGRIARTSQSTETPRQDNGTIFLNIDPATAARGFDLSTAMDTESSYNISLAYYQHLAQKWSLSYYYDESADAAVYPCFASNPEWCPFRIYTRISMKNNNNTVAVNLDATKLVLTITPTVAITLVDYDSIGLFLRAKTFVGIVSVLTTLMANRTGYASNPITGTLYETETSMFGALVCSGDDRVIVPDIIEILRIIYFVLVPIFAVESSVIHTNYIQRVLDVFRNIRIQDDNTGDVESAGAADNTDTNMGAAAGENTDEDDEDYEEDDDEDDEDYEEEEDDDEDDEDDGYVSGADSF